ncbi:uncharacterized protein LOC110842020 isoform X2 [Folsomia candida]|uniref:uncharacterized protein LOC110842020 isoform X2 n=1 Tax=Folsomia candida TaxID=158441 RepID=UPI000B8F2BC9|nr:uncharacterized protein LOC110842020 isoform X2 [Folsomia candida]
MVSSGGSDGGGGAYCRHRRKSFLLICALSLVLLLYSNSGGREETGNRVIIKSLIFPFSTGSDDTSADDASLFLVHTAGCKLRHMDPFSSVVDTFLRDGAIHACHEPLVTLVTPTTTPGESRLVVSGALLKKWKYKGASCCWRRITRRTQSPDKYDNDADYGVDIDTKNCGKIPGGGNGVVIPGDVQYVKVECHNELKVQVWKDFFPLVPSPRNLSPGTKTKAKFWDEQKLKSNPNKKTSSIFPPSVLVIGIDSISRLHMIRSMPRTKEFLTANGFTEMKGYTKVGDNTFPNIMAAFAGMTEAETIARCWPSRHTKLDDCPFLWKNFSRMNYVTAHVEDSPGIAIFNYDKTGFVLPPSDYYLRPLMVAEHQAGRNRHRFGGANDCLGGGLTPTRVLLRYIRSFVREVGGVTPFFLLSWFTSMAHDDFNGLKPYDQDFRSFLSSILSSVGEDTLILFISDHGYRFGAFRETFLGFYEESLPFFFLRMPPRLSSPSWSAALRTNAARLTSPHDLYATLVQLIDLVNNKNTSSPSPYGTSFLATALENRTCESSAIPEKYCMCGVSPSLTTSSRLSAELGVFIVTQINADLSAQNLTSLCSPVNYTTFLYGRQVGEGEVWNGVGKLEPYRDVLIAFETSPWEGRFEARVRIRDNAAMTLLGSVGRINSYAGKSDCITHYKMKNYCTCKNLWEAEVKKREKKKQEKKKKG